MTRTAKTASRWAIVTMSRGPLLVFTLLLSTSSGCAHRAKLEAQLECANEQKRQLAAVLDDERARSTTVAQALAKSNQELATARGETEGQKQRAASLERELDHARTIEAQLHQRVDELIDQLVKALSTKSRNRGLVDELLRLKRAGTKTTLTYDACNDCTETK